MGSTPRAPAPEIPGVELTGVVGSGGSGVVYLGRQRGFGRDVAVKVAARDAAPDDALRRWEREVAAIGRLSNHPNIVPVFDAGITDDGSPYLVMPYVPGGTLSDRLREEGPMTPERVRVVGAKLAGALAAVHAAGILHRDVKPDNVLWTPHGEPQLTDFGIARLQDLTTTTTGALQATIAYAAPEVLAGEPATEAADLYGLGATLHACLTGSAPYPTDGDNLGALVARVLEHPPAPLRAGGVPGPLAAVVERAMHRDPAQRPASASDLRDELRSPDVASVSAPPLPTTADTTVLPAADATPPAGTNRVVVPPPPAPRPSPPADGPPRPAEPAERSRSLWLAVGAVLLLFLGLLAYGLARDDDDAGTASEDPGTTAPAAGPEEIPPTERSSTTTEPRTTTTTTATTTTTTQPSAASDTREMGAEARTYFGLLQQGRLDDAWERTTNRFQNNQDRDAWEAFWGGFDRIRIVGPLAPDPGSRSVVVPLDLDGQREDYTLELGRQGGEWRVDGPVGNPTGGGDDD